MKMKLLFVMSCLPCGGAEKSLISLLQTLDYERYDVDLFLFKQEGHFLSQIPAQVRLIDEQPAYRCFDMPIAAATASCVRQGRLGLAYSRLRAGLILRSKQNAAVREQRSWPFVSRAFKPLEDEYDAAIGYLEKNPIYFIADKVRAKRKLGWVHTNYTNMGMDSRIDRPYFEQLDSLVTVSDECANALRNEFPEMAGKISVVNNIVSPSVIRASADASLPNETEWDSGAFNIVTVARLNPVKGIDLAIEACKLLVEAGYNVRWSVIGDGSDKEYEACSRLIEAYSLGGRFRLLGVQANPYPYVKRADLYVQPSRFEGKSIAIDEAKSLHKPIVVTDFSTAKDQIEAGVNGWIAAMNPGAIMEAIRMAIDHPNRSQAWSKRLAEEPQGTEQEIEKFYTLLRDEQGQELSPQWK